MYKQDELMPIITYETFTSITDYASNESKEEFIKDNLENIISENPIVYDQLNFFSKRFKEPTDSVFLGTLTYKMLKEQGSIPKVKKETVNELVKEIDGSHVKKGYIEDIMSKITTENTYLASAIEKFSEKSKNPFDGTFSATIIYRMLELQIKNDKKSEIMLFDDSQKKYPKTYHTRKTLNDAIINEDYEKAADLRDEINKTDEPLY